MDACMLHHGDFAFGETVVAPRRREVLHRGIRVDIGDRAFDLLLLLAESHGSVLSKQQIVARVWNDRVGHLLVPGHRFEEWPGFFQRPGPGSDS